MMTVSGPRLRVLLHVVQRVRPKVMTVSVILAGLLPIMWSHGTGADVMKRSRCRWSAVSLLIHHGAARLPGHLLRLVRLASAGVGGVNRRVGASGANVDFEVTGLTVNSNGMKTH